MADENDLLAQLEEANKPNDQTNWHVIASSKKGEFQWIVSDDGDILDCPYHLRGYWIGRKVDMRKLLADKPSIIVTCTTTGHVDRIQFDDFDVLATTDTHIPDYKYDTPYTGGLYDIRQER